MSGLLGIARFRFREGKTEEYLRLADQAMEIVRTKDSGMRLRGGDRTRREPRPPVRTDPGDGLGGPR